MSLTRWDSALHPDKGQEFLDEIGDVFFANTNVKHSCLAKYYLFVLSVLGKRGGGGEEASAFSLEEQVKETTKEVEQLTLHFNKASEDATGAKETAEFVRRSARNQKGDGGGGGDGGEENEEDAEITDDTITEAMKARLEEAKAYLAELAAAVELQTAKGKSVRIARMAANAKLPPASVEKKRGRYPIRAHEELTDEERAVDCTWFASVLSTISGPMKHTWQTASEKKSFVESFSTLTKVLNLSSHKSKVAVFNRMGACTFNGTPSDLYNDFTTLMQQVSQVGLTIDDWLMQSLLSIVQDHDQAKIKIATMIDAEEYKPEDEGGKGVLGCLSEVCKLLETQGAADSSSQVNMMRQPQSSLSLASLQEKVTRLEQAAASKGGGQHQGTFRNQCFACGKKCGNSAKFCKAPQAEKDAYAAAGAAKKKQVNAVAIVPTPPPPSPFPLPHQYTRDRRRRQKRKSC